MPKIFTIPILFFCFLLCSCGFINAKYFNQGLDLYINGEYDEAVHMFETSMKHKYRLEESYYFLTQISSLTDKKLFACDELKKINGKESSLYFLCKGQQELKLNNYRDAIQNCSKVKNFLEEVIEKDTLLCLADSYKGLKNYNKLINVLEEGISRLERKEIFYLYKHTALYNQEKYEELFNSIQEALKYDAEFSCKSSRKYAILHSWAKRWGEVIKLSDLCTNTQVSQAITQDYIIDKITALTELSFYEEARKILQSELRDSSSNYMAKLLELRAILNANQGKLEDAFKDISLAINLEKSSRRYHIGAHILAKQGNFLGCKRHMDIANTLLDESIRESNVKLGKKSKKDKYTDYTYMQLFNLCNKQIGY